MSLITIQNIKTNEIRAAYGADAIGPCVQRMLAAAEAYEDADTEAAKAAEAEFAAAKSALLASSETIPWQCASDGEGHRIVIAACAADALDKTEDGAGDGYDLSEGTVWVRLAVRSMLHEECEERTLAVDPPEPGCVDGGHDWQSPRQVLGRHSKSPGVCCNQGGVIITEVCARCGAYRVTDTWAYDPATGEQGLTSVSYQAADEASLAWVESLREEAECAE